MTVLDGWEQIPILNHPGGAFVDTDAPYRGVLHSTEGNSIEGAVGAYTAAGVPPQLTIDPAEGRKAQHIDLERSAYALVHPSGCETNKLKCVQIEIVMYADADRAIQNGGLHVSDLTDEHYRFIAGCLREVEAAVPIQPVFATPWVDYPASYGRSAAQRFDVATWTDWGGWCGHQHVPGNEHGDPGQLDTVKLIPGGDDDLNDADRNWLDEHFQQIVQKQDAQEAEIKALKDKLDAVATSKVSEIQRNLRRVGFQVDAKGIEGKVPEYPVNA